jgi:hypothetical protein
MTNIAYKHNKSNFSLSGRSGTLILHAALFHIHLLSVQSPATRITQGLRLGEPRPTGAKPNTPARPPVGRLSPRVSPRGLTICSQVSLFTHPTTNPPPPQGLPLGERRPTGANSRIWKFKRPFAGAAAALGLRCSAALRPGQLPRRLPAFALLSCLLSYRPLTSVARPPSSVLLLTSDH